MAVIATLVEPVTIDAIEALPQLPIGVLNDSYVLGEQTGLDSPYLLAGRFPTPPTAQAFLTAIDAFDEDPIVVESISNILAGAVFPEADFLEPTRGQIWPRIG